MKLGFNDYLKNKAKKDLANYLVENLSSQEISEFNEALQILEWEWNPFASATKGAGAGIGATIGSAAGPLGTLAGGVIGGAVGGLANRAVGGLMSGVRVQPLVPAHDQAIKAVDALSNMLNAPDIKNVAGVDKVKGNVDKIKQYLGGLSDQVTKIDQQRNADLDAHLQSQGKMGIRRKVAKGMDAVQGWARRNPMLAGAANLAAGAAGAYAGATGAQALGAQNWLQGSQNQSGSQVQRRVSRNASEFQRGKGVPSGEGGGGIDEPSYQSTMQQDPTYQRNVRIFGKGKANDMYSRRMSLRRGL